MEVPVKNLQGEVVSTAELDERVWDIQPNIAVLHQAVVAQQANARRGTADTKTRGEVRGSTRKLWRQKGTGRARQGSGKAPHWRGGGTVFGPHPRDWHQDLPKRMRRLAMRSALSAKVDDDAVMLVDVFELPDGKTKAMLRSLATLEAAGRALIVLPQRDQLVERAGSNIKTIRIATPSTLNLLDVLNAQRLILTPSAAEALTEKLLRQVRPRKTVSARTAAVGAASSPEAAAPRAVAGSETERESEEEAE